MRIPTKHISTWRDGKNWCNLAPAMGGQYLADKTQPSKYPYSYRAKNCGVQSDDIID
jgi:hypothetical protein